VRSENAASQLKITRWFDEEWRKNLEERFAPYLDLKLKHSVGGFILGSVGWVVVLAALLVYAGDTSPSRFELLGGGSGAGSIVFRLNRSSGQVCVYRYDEAKQHEGLKRISCAAEEPAIVATLTPTTVATPTKP
jgi:hypothetical protein